MSHHARKLTTPSTLWAGLLALAGALPAAAQAPALSAAETLALRALGPDEAFAFTLVDSWYHGIPIQYYHIGIEERGAVNTLYRVRGGGAIVSSVPGLPGYASLHVVYDVVPEEGLDPATIVSHDTVLALVRAGRARLVHGGPPINAPVVPQGSTLVDDPFARPLLRAWYRGHAVAYFDFGPTPGVPIPLAGFAAGTDAYGDPLPLERPSNASAVPGQAGYSDLWAIVLADVGAPDGPAYRDYRRVVDDARRGRIRLVPRDLVVNCPVVLVDGQPASR